MQHQFNPSPPARKAHSPYDPRFCAICGTEYIWPYRELSLQDFLTDLNGVIWEGHAERCVSLVVCTKGCWDSLWNMPLSEVMVGRAA